MESLCYFLSFLLKDGEVGFAAPNDITDTREVFRYIKEKKAKMTTNDLIDGVDESGSL